LQDISSAITACAASTRSGSPAPTYAGIATQAVVERQLREGVVLDCPVLPASAAST
jgi:hypothetical protein